MIEINIADQTLKFTDKTYLISSAKNGIGELEGSHCTPIGKFKIAEKIGINLKTAAVLFGRVPTGEIFSPELAKKHLNRDWILTRILWLDGVETHNQNTKSRYIYIHGTPDEVKLGVVGSQGCVRMRNADIIKIFEQVVVGDEVVIK